MQDVNGLKNPANLHYCHTSFVTRSSLNAFSLQIVNLSSPSPITFLGICDMRVGIITLDKPVLVQ